MTVSKDVEAVERDGRGVGTGTEQHVIPFFPPNKLLLEKYKENKSSQKATNRK